MRFTSTFNSKADRSRRALEAEGVGLESALDAARRLNIRPFLSLNEYSEQADNGAEEYHHIRWRGTVEAVDYRTPSQWDNLGSEMKSGVVQPEDKSSLEGVPSPNAEEVSRGTYLMDWSDATKESNK